jgi:hypothetical protein
MYIHDPDFLMLASHLEWASGQSGHRQGQSIDEFEGGRKQVA